MTTRRTMLRARLPRADDDRGSIALLMLAIMVSTAIGALLLAMVINQDRATRFGSSRLRALDGAQAGIDVMLGQIRHATAIDSSGATYGDDNQLPCGPLSGSANGTGTVTYTVSVAYYLSDPATGATAMKCAPGYGAYDPATGSHTPRFVRITSIGVEPSVASSTSPGRTLTTTYALQTDDRNIAGGQFRLYGGGAGLCMDAGSAQPASGALVSVQTCSTSTPVAAQQVFAYRTDLSIQLVSSVTTTAPLGLCLDTSTATHQAGSQIVLKPCNTLGTAAWNQQWSFDGFGHLEGSVATTPSTGTDGWVISANPASAGQPLTLSSSDTSVTSTSQTWVPAPTAGAGGAGSSNNQIVNYRSFATCIDVTNNDPSSAFLILYSCKQNPSPGAIDANQKFTPALGPPSKTALPQTTALTTILGASYCMQSPVASGGYVTVRANCTTTWTWNQTKDSNGGSLPYAQVYTIVDPSGRCLSPGPSTDLYNGSYLKLIVTTCDGGTEQKWNADPSVLASRLFNTGEK